MRSVIKYVPYKVRPDDTAEIEHEARCVFGDEVECGAESGPRSDPAEVDVWMREHTRETRHGRYRQSMAGYVLWEAIEPVPSPVAP
ncbi:hypothetical protein F9278_38345 [Streptomyces phaeolivaceus]|uniref:DUF7848 domain-containing protein n=1 Tax=Streptomyces phaeolivaceus TaxID=2653200 RepID=A0A5P8KEX6_9ACTN|nr:hypothetical protein [Streptomyces phaeolivaceus]QFR01080.1 hypothetical protein F9278_38345 [Streptomyces phaeolivaceus]